MRTPHEGMLEEGDRVIAWYEDQGCEGWRGTVRYATNQQGEMRDSNFTAEAGIDRDDDTTGGGKGDTWCICKRGNDTWDLQDEQGKGFIIREQIDNWEDEL